MAPPESPHSPPPGVVVAQDLVQQMVLLRQAIASLERTLLLHASAVMTSQGQPQAGANNLLATIAKLLKK